MIIQNFQPGVKPLAADLNAISLNTQGAFSDFITAFSNSSVGTLFTGTEPLAEKVGTDITISTPAQLVGIDGCIGTTPAYSEDFDVDDGGGGELDLYVEVFFVLKQIPVLATRNFHTQEPTNSATVIQNLETEIATTFRFEVVYLSGNVIGASQTPTIGPDDGGFIKLAEISYQQSNQTLTVTQDAAARFTLPAGVSVPILPHAASHLPGGTDPIDLAEIDNTIVSGSTVGLMPEGAYSVTLQSILDLQPTAGAEFLSFTTTGTNTVVEGAFDPRLLRVGFSYDNSLTVYNNPQSPTFGLNFLSPSTSAGTLSRPARADHTHALSESGFVIINKEISLNSTVTGTLVTTDITASDTEFALERILDVKYQWEPRNLDAVAGFGASRLDVDWQIEPSGGAVGARTLVIDSNTIQTEIGDFGIARLTPVTQARVEEWTSPQYTGGVFPKQGTLHLTIIALREGASA